MLREQLDLNKVDLADVTEVNSQLKVRLEDTNQELEKEQRSCEDAINEVSRGGGNGSNSN